MTPYGVLRTLTAYKLDHFLQGAECANVRPKLPNRRYPLSNSINLILFTAVSNAQTTSFTSVDESRIAAITKSGDILASPIRGAPLLSLRGNDVYQIFIFPSLHTRRIKDLNGVICISVAEDGSGDTAPELQPVPMLS